MAYFITLSNGASQIIINDETIDTTTTSLTLIGRNTIGIGSIINGNELHQLENFASSASPSHPMIGQLWYNSQTQVMMVCTGNNPTAAWAPVTQVAGFSGNITVSDLKQAGLAPLDSPVFTGVPLTTTPDGSQAQQVATVGYVSSQLPPTRIRLTTNLNVYISNSGSDNNDGMTSGTAWATLQHAYNTISQNYDLNGFGVKFNVAAGSYAGFFMVYPLVGQKAQVAVEVAGAGPATVINSAPSGAGSIVATLSAGAYIHDLTVTNSNDTTLDYNSTGYGLYADQDAYVIIDNITFGACGQTQMAAVRGAVIAVQDVGATFTVTGSAQALMFASQSGEIVVSDAAFTWNNIVTYSKATVWSEDCSRVYVNNCTFTNPSNVNGPRFYCDIFSVVSTGTGNTSFIPGNSAGVLNPSGAGAYYA